MVKIDNGKMKKKLLRRNAC